VRIFSSFLFILLTTLSVSAFGTQSYTFGVVPLRSAVLTAQYWNPILDYVGTKAGVSLKLQIASSPKESALAVVEGKYDFNYSYLNFRAKAVKQKYKVILKPAGGNVRSQIVTLASSPIRSLVELKSREVGFPSKAGFIAYAVPMDYLLRQNIAVKPVFGGNQEGILGQLKAGQVVAAGVSSQIMTAYAARENLAYRVLWESALMEDFPISAHPRVDANAVSKVQAVFANMQNEPEGLLLLTEAANSVGQKPPYGFIKSRPADYRQFVNFYRDTLVKDLE